MTMPENKQIINSKKFLFYTMIFVITLSFVVFSAYTIQLSPQETEYSIPIDAGQYFTKSFSLKENDSLLISYKNQNLDPILFAVLKNSEYNAWSNDERPFNSIVFDFLYYQSSATNVNVSIHTTDDYIILISNIRNSGSKFVNNEATTIAYNIQLTSGSSTQNLELGQGFSTFKGNIVYHTTAILFLIFLTIFNPIIIFSLENRSPSLDSVENLDKVWESPSFKRYIFSFLLITFGYFVYVMFLVIRSYVDMIAIDMIFFVSISNLIISFRSRLLNWTSLITKIYYFAMSGVLFIVMLLLERLDVVAHSITGFINLILVYVTHENPNYSQQAIDLLVSLFVLTTLVFLYLLYSILFKERNSIDFKNKVIIQELIVGLHLGTFRKILDVDDMTKGEVKKISGSQAFPFRKFSSRKAIFYSFYLYDADKSYQIVKGNQKEVYQIAYRLMLNFSIPFEVVYGTNSDSKNVFTKEMILESYPDLYHKFN